MYNFHNRQSGFGTSTSGSGHMGGSMPTDFGAYIIALGGVYSIVHLKMNNDKLAKEVKKLQGVAKKQAEHDAKLKEAQDKANAGEKRLQDLKKEHERVVRCLKACSGIN